MKFVVVNHEPPSCPATCSTCSRSIRSGYVRHVQTKLRYCDHDCYRRGELVRRSMYWSGWLREPATASLEVVAGNIIEMLAVMTAVSCWSCTIFIWTFARASTGAHLDGRDRIATEGGEI